MKNQIIKIAIVVIAIMHSFNSFAGKKPSLKDAIFNQDIEKMKELFAQGADANEQFTGQPAIIWAISDGNCDIIRLLIEKGASINDDRGIFPVFHSIYSAKEPEEMLETNRKNNALILKRCKGDAVKASQWLKHEDITRFSTIADKFNLLVELGCDINAYDGAGEVTVLLQAVKKKNIPILKLALESKKCDLELRYHQWAEKQVGYAKSIHTANFNSREGKMTAKEWAQVPQFKTSLLYAIDEKDIELVKLLVEGGADVNNGMKGEGGDGKGNYEWWMIGPLDFAIDKGNEEIVDYLKNNGAKRLNDK